MKLRSRRVSLNYQAKRYITKENVTQKMQKMLTQQNAAGSLHLLLSQNILFLKIMIDSSQ